MILLSTHYFINKTLYYSPELTSMCLKIAKHKASLVRFDVVCGIASREADTSGTRLPGTAHTV